MSVGRDLSVIPVPPAWQHFGGAMEGSVRVTEVGRCGTERVQIGALIDPDLADRLREFAAKDNRSVSNAVATLLAKALADRYSAVPAGWEATEVR